MLPLMKTYVEKVAKKPVVESFDIVSDARKHPFFESRLEFFKSVAIQLEPFLRKFQSSKPMAPFLYEEILGLLRSLLSRFVKKSAMAAADTGKKLMTINLAKDSSDLKGIKDVDIG